MSTEAQIPVKVEVNSNWAGLVQDSMFEVFDMMLGVKLIPHDCLDFVAEITAMVGLAGSLCGLFSIRCSYETGATMASKMLGLEKVDNEHDIRDAVGEICNMVAGNFKAKAPELNDNCMLSVPTTVTGQDYQVYPMRAMPPVVVLYALCEGAPIEVLLHVYH